MIISILMIQNKNRKMLHTQTRTNPHPQALSIPANSNNLHQLINSDPILTAHFRNCTNMGQYWNMAHELMLDGLRYRARSGSRKTGCCCADGIQDEVEGNVGLVEAGRDIQNRNWGDGDRKCQKTPSKQKPKHYNVSYVKHNRFLSPHQRKQLVTPKVTEVIPSKTGPLVIYGKPRVRVDNQCGCPYHDNEEQCLRSIPYGGLCQPKTSRSRPVHQVHVRQPSKRGNSPKDHRVTIEQPNELSRYKSSPNLNQHPQHQQTQPTENLNKTRKNSKQKSNKPNPKPQSNQIRIQASPSSPKQVHENIVYVNRIVEVETRVPGKMRTVRSPKSRIPDEQESMTVLQDSYLSSRYHHGPQEKTGKRQVESKIKFLIERDKKNKEMQKNLKKQQKKIIMLEKLIKDDKKVLQNKKTVKISAKQILTLSSDSSDSSMEMMDSALIKKFKNKQNQLQNQKQSYEMQESQQVHSAAYFGQECSNCSKTLSDEQI